MCLLHILLVSRPERGDGIGMHGGTLSRGMSSRQYGVTVTPVKVWVETSFIPKVFMASGVRRILHAGLIRPRDSWGPLL